MRWAQFCYSHFTGETSEVRWGSIPWRSSRADSHNCDAQAAPFRRERHAEGSGLRCIHSETCAQMGLPDSRATFPDAQILRLPKHREAAVVVWSGCETFGAKYQSSPSSSALSALCDLGWITYILNASLFLFVNEMIFFFQPVSALAGVAQWIECRPANQSRRFYSQSRALAWVAGQVGFPVGGAREATTSWCFPLSLSLCLK